MFNAIPKENHDRVNKASKTNLIVEKEEEKIALLAHTVQSFFLFFSRAHSVNLRIKKSSSSGGNLDI